MRKLREPYLDGESLFRKYFEMGAATSAQRLAKWALSVGMASPVKRSKRNPEGLPTMGVWKAMWRWASLKENKDKAFPIFADYVDKYGWKLPDTDLPWNGDKTVLWHQFMLQKIKTAWQFTREARYERFLKENGWL